MAETYLCYVLRENVQWVQKSGGTPWSRVGASWLTSLFEKNLGKSRNSASDCHWFVRTHKQ